VEADVSAEPVTGLKLTPPPAALELASACGMMASTE
jgi:hypothetical protein